MMREKQTQPKWNKLTRKDENAYHYEYERALRECDAFHEALRR